MFSGIGYGQVLPSKWKIVSSSQSLIGTLYLPLLAAYLWMFIKNKIAPIGIVEANFDNDNLTESDDGTEVNIPGLTKHGLVIQRNILLNIFQVIETDTVKAKRQRFFNPIACKQCESKKIEIIVFIDPRDTIRLKKYICRCESCGNIGEKKTNAICAVLSWNRRNEKINF